MGTSPIIEGKSMGGDRYMLESNTVTLFRVYIFVPSLMGKLLAEHQFVIFFQKSECHRMHTDLHRQFFVFAEVRDITFHGKDPYEETKKRFRAQMLKYENEKLETKFKFAGKKTDDDVRCVCITDDLLVHMNRDLKTPDIK